MRLFQFSVLAVAIVAFCFATTASASIIPGSWVVEHHYELGEAEGGVAGNAGAPLTVDSVGGVDMAKGGSPVYSAGNTSAVGMRFNNLPTGVNPEPATDYYSDPAYDYNPTDDENWGLSFDINANSLPSSGDQEVGLVHLGINLAPNLAIELWKGEYIVHLQGATFNQTGLTHTPGQWDHVEFAIENGVWSFEVNGTSVAPGPAGPFDPNTGITIGAFNNSAPGYTRGLDGTIDDLKIYGVVPEPSAIVLLGIAFGCLGFTRRR